MSRPWPTKVCCAMKKRNISFMCYEGLICYVRHLDDVGLVDFLFYQIKDGEMRETLRTYM